MLRCSILATKNMGRKKMINKIKTVIAVAVLSGTVGANVQAEGLTIEKGDTLWDLSQIHNTTVENIKSRNQLSTDLIHPGDVLTVPTEEHYTVKLDDTLWDIALKFNVTVGQIKSWNKLTTNLIHPGLNLVVYTDLPTETQVGAKLSTAASSQSDNKIPSPVKTTPQAGKQAKIESKLVAAAPSTNDAVQEQDAAPTSDASSKEITVKATAYTASCGGCSGITATGINLKADPNAKVISVDPSVIPLGTKVFVEGYGYATAADTGGAIKGNRIDVFIPTKQDAINYGTKQVKVKVLN
jgi:3D (Asp-Asp-Asp) domain-containing protein/LysM repeat protein